jgi:uncharacterized membrane protein YfcA
VSTPEGLVLVAIIGFLAQLVDGSLGMGFGVTSATLLATIGMSPAIASATIHVAKIGTGTAAGLSHWRFGNVHWRAALMLALPGAAGAFVGALVLSYVAAEVAAPWVALILFVLGCVVLARTVVGRAPAVRLYSPRLRSLGTLGVVGGFVDSVGGGGWGPVTTSTLMAANQLPPNKVIGTVSAAELVVAFGSTIGFLLALGAHSVPFDATLALLVGGVLAAPIAAWAVSRLDHRVLGALVGGMILFYNAEKVLSLVGLSGGAVVAARLAIIAGTLATVAWVLRSRRVDRSRSAAEDGSAGVPGQEATPAAAALQARQGTVIAVEVETGTSDATRSSRDLAVAATVPVPVDDARGEAAAVPRAAARPR